VVAKWDLSDQAAASLEFVCDLVIMGVRLVRLTDPGPLVSVVTILSDAKRLPLSDLILPKLLQAFDSAMEVVQAALAGYADCRLSFIFASPGFLELWGDSADQAPHFSSVMRSLPPESFQSVDVDPTIDLAQFPVVEFETIIDMFFFVLLGDDESAQSSLMSLTCRLLGPPQPDFLLFITKSVAVDSVPRPDFVSESLTAHALFGAFPAVIAAFVESGTISPAFCQLVESSFFAAPGSLVILAPDIIRLYLASRPETAAAKFLFDTIHHLFVFCPRLTDLLTAELSDRLLGTDDRSPIGIQMLFILRDSADRSVLSGACVEYALASVCDENADLLVRMIDNGLVPASFAAPAMFGDLRALCVANALWRNLPETREVLRRLMRSVLRDATAVDMFRLSPCLKEAIEYLRRR
jgi:hypothetical protein